MSNSPQKDDPLESGAVSGVPPSLNGEAPTQHDPLPKSDPEAVPPAPPVPDPDEVSAGEDEDDDEEGEELDEETLPASSTKYLCIQPPTINDCHVSSPDVVLASPTGRRGGGKRKKGKGKGKGKPSARKQQAIELKLQILRQNLNPIPFIPHKILDFAHHEKLLRKLGLWEFVHIDFDRTIRVEFIAQLVANYNPKSRNSNVNGCRVMVNRADLARSLKLPFKKERVEVVLDSEDLSDDSLGFLLGLLSDWVLLHEDMWLIPHEVSDWMKLIKDGHPEKVDWAALLWFMVEKELKQGEQLRDCHYASHLQQLIKYQRDNLFLVEEDVVKDEVEVVEKADKEDEVELVEKAGKEDEVELVEKGDKEDGVELVEKADKEDEVEPVEKAGKEEEDGVNEEKMKDVDVVENTEEGKEGDSVVQGPSTELTLGQEKEDEQGGAKEDEEGEGVKDLKMVSAEKCKDSSDEEVGGDDHHDHDHDRDDQDQEQEPWLLNGKDIQGEHFLQRCTAQNADEFTNFEDRKDEEEEEMEEDEDGEEEDDDDAARNNFHVFPNDDSLEGDGFTGNFLQGLEGNQMAFTSQEQLRNSSVDARVDVLHMASTPSFFNNSGKRVIEHEYDHSVNDNNNKRMRINETWDNKPLDFATCMEQIQQVAQRARILYEEKEQATEQSTMNQQILLNELQKRDAVIEHLHKARLEETQKKDITINRLERELYLMGSVLDGYRKALKETRKVFAEYKERAKLVEEPTYRDAGQGGLMLTAAEIERRRKKREEEFRMNCLYVEQRMKEVEEEYALQFHEHADRVNFLDNRLMGLKAGVKELIALHSNQKTTPTKHEEEEKEVVAEDVETLPVAEPMEEEAVGEEVSSQPENVQVAEPEVQVPEAADGDEPSPQPEEKAADGDEPSPQPEEKAADGDEPSPQPEEKAAEVAEPLSVE